MALLDSLEAQFPELFRLGFGDMIVQGVRDGKDGNQIIAEIRATDEYRRQFPGITAPDGSRRFASESEYMRAVDDYRNVLREYGMWSEDMEGPNAFVGFFDNQIDPNELRDRLNIYRTAQRNSSVRDAFYVYAGMNLTDDDLYELAVSGDRSGLIAEYNARTSGSTLDYETFVTRVTELSVARIAEVVTELRSGGIISELEAQRILNADPEQARNLIGAIYQSGGQAMDLESLVTTFEYAMLGSAASEQGLVMPDAERLEQFRLAGINRSQAQRAWGTFAAQQGVLAGASMRAGGRRVTQELYEEAVLLGSGSALAELNRATATERTYGQRGGGFAEDMAGNRIVQSGRIPQGLR